ncbi:MAG: hypothetical protein ABIK09_11870 [Pseudomonadota bacterium]
MTKTLARFLVMVSFLFAGSLRAPAQEIPPDEPVPGEDTPVETSSIEVDPYSVYSKGQIQETYIDEDFKLYEVRPYQGVVPGHPERGEVAGGEALPARGEKITLERIGLEQKELFSRVFAVADGAVTPWVYDNFATADANPGTPYHIVMEITGGKIPKRTDRLPLDARAFNTPILTIQGVPFKGGVRVIIILKRKARYLPAQVGRTLYVDIER